MNDMTSDPAAWCALDLETASEKPGSICEIAVVFYGADGTVLSQNGEFSSLVDLPEGFRFSSEFSKLHGITSADVRGRPQLPEIMQQLRPRLQDIRIVAHNAGFDFKHLAAARQIYPELWVPSSSQFVDTLRISRYSNPSLAKHKLQDFARQYGAKYNPQKAHSALYDAQVLAEAFSRYVQATFAGDFAKAFHKYDSLPAAVGSYKWWKHKKGSHVQPTHRQREYVQALVEQGYLSSQEVASAFNTKKAYSKLIERAQARKTRGSYAPDGHARSSTGTSGDTSGGGSSGQGGGCFSLLSLASSMRSLWKHFWHGRC